MTACTFTASSHVATTAIIALDEGGPEIYDPLARITPFLATAHTRRLLTSRPEADILQLFGNKVMLQATVVENSRVGNRRANDAA